MLLAVGALIGVSSIANAQKLPILKSVRGDEWNPKWDSCMWGHKAGKWHQPNRPAGPDAYGDYRGLIRLYQGVPVRIDTALVIPGGKNRRYVFKNMPKDEQGRHYIVEVGTAKVYPEADTVRLPDSKDSTVIPMTIVHYALSPGDHDENHVDGYSGVIQVEVKMSQIWNPTAGGGTGAYQDFSTSAAQIYYYGGPFHSTYFWYQYFKLPGVTASSRYRKPAPMDSGIFEVRWDGALIVNPYSDKVKDWTGGYSTRYNYMWGTNGADVFAAYYSLDGGATWLGASAPGFKLNKQQIAELPDEFSLLVKLPGGIQYSVLNAVGIISPADPTGNNNRPTPENPAIRPDYTRQITVNNSTDAVLIPAQQFYDVPSGNDFVFTIRPAAGKVPKVTTSRNNKTPDNLGVEIKPSTKEPGGYDVRIRKVREELTVTVTYEGNSNVEAAATRVWGENGQLYIMSSAAGRANVYNVLGKLNRSVTLSAGETKSVSVPAGIYVVSMNNGKAYKVAVR
mgnify:CR=1 FL=1